MGTFVIALLIGIIFGGLVYVIIDQLDARADKKEDKNIFDHAEEIRNDFQ